MHTHTNMHTHREKDACMHMFMIDYFTVNSFELQKYEAVYVNRVNIWM